MHWILDSVPDLLRRIPRQTSVLALRCPGGLPDAWTDPLLLAATAFLEWVRWPTDPMPRCAEVLAARAIELAWHLLALVRSSPLLSSELELELVGVEDLRPLPGQPLATWWTELLGQAQAALGAEA